MTKTTVTWIGKKTLKGQRENTSKVKKLGRIRIQIAGVKFSVDIDKVPQTNHVNATNKVCILINLWNYRSLTPLGKVTVIKTFLLPQLNHLFSSALTPKNILTVQMNLFFRFLWDRSSI